MTKSVRIIVVVSFTLLGILCIASGIMYSSLQSNNIDQKILVVVEQKQVSTIDDVELKLKNLTIEVNTPLSVKIVDYLDVAVSNEVLANLKLDTSSVNVTEIGTYTYTIDYNEKTYQGLIIVKAKEEEPTNTMPTITLKTLNIKLGTALTTDLTNYVVEPLTDEIKATMALDLSNVNVNLPGTYQYTITYNNSIYTGNIIITEDQPTLSTGIKEEEPTTTDPSLETTPDITTNQTTATN